MPQAKPRISIVIPTYNRVELLKLSLESALMQDDPLLDIVVLDNHSDDGTQDFMREQSDPRISYVRNDSNIGLFRNFQKAIHAARGKFITLLQDDDVLQPGFARHCTNELEGNASLAMVIVNAVGIDINGHEVQLPEDPPPSGTMSGLDYLENMVDGKNWVIHMSGVMMRRELVLQHGNFDNPHSSSLIDVNLYFRLASQHSFMFLPKNLVNVRIHEDRTTTTQFNAKDNVGPMAILSDRIDAVALLLDTDRARSDNYRKRLTERLLHLNVRRSDATDHVLKQCNLSWEQEVLAAGTELMNAIPDGSTFILVDDEIWRHNLPKTLNAIPFLERDGQHDGVASCDQSAIAELIRLRDKGAKYLVVARPGLWWLDYYSGFRKFLNDNCHLEVVNSRLRVYKFP